MKFYLALVTLWYCYTSTSAGGDSFSSSDVSPVTPSPEMSPEEIQGLYDSVTDALVSDNPELFNQLKNEVANIFLNSGMQVKSDPSRSREQIIQENAARSLDSLKALVSSVPTNSFDPWQLAVYAQAVGNLAITMSSVMSDINGLGIIDFDNLTLNPLIVDILPDLLTISGHLASIAVNPSGLVDLIRNPETFRAVVAFSHKIIEKSWTP